MASTAILDDQELRLLRSVLVESDPGFERAVLSSADPSLLRRIAEIRTLLAEDVAAEFEHQLNFDRPTCGPLSHHIPVLQEVLDVASAYGIDVRLIKGIALIQLEPWRSRGRIFGDLDVLVPSSQAEQLVFALRAAGFSPAKRDISMSLLLRSDRSIDLVRDAYAIDVHWRMDELLDFDEESDPFNRPGDTLVIQELDGIPVPVVPRPYLLLQVAARLGRSDRKARLRGLVDACALVQMDNDVLLDAASISPSPLVTLRLHRLAEEIGRINPGVRSPVEPPELSRSERLHEMLSGPTCPVAHWSTDLAAKFISLSAAGHYSFTLRDAGRYVLARRWGVQVNPRVIR